ncbi:MAG: HAMP domain-containing histidine kinase [Streptomycetaceae bacterium]|nr:HAMP domain-containing histidine kinase [Streptomycetaceae bacterium]
MRARVILLVVATSALVLAGFLVPLALLVRTTAADRAVSAASMEAQALVPAVAGTDPEQLRRTIDQANTGAAHRMTVFLPDGTQIGAPADRSAAVGQAQAGQSLSADLPGGKEVLVAVAGRPDGVAVIRTEVTDDELMDGVGGAWLTLALLGGGVLLVSMIVADRLARSLIRPLSSVAVLAERLATGDLAARAEVTGSREVRQLAAGLNRLAQRIGGLLAHEREAVADLSHRLRTPLTALRIDVDGLSDPAERAVLAGDVDALGRAVDEVIRLARRPPVPITARVCDATTVVRERAEFWSPLADEEERPFDVRLPGVPLVVGLDGDSLATCVDALLGNVFAYTPDGTPLLVTLERDADSGGATLVVADRGPGLGPGWQPGRGRSAGGSTGLGLDIVHRTAAASGGAMRLERTPGGGLTVVVRLGPSAAQQLRRDVGGRHRRP